MISILLINLFTVVSHADNLNDLVISDILHEIKNHKEQKNLFIKSVLSSQSGDQGYYTLKLCWADKDGSSSLSQSVGSSECASNKLGGREISQPELVNLMSSLLTISEELNEERFLGHYISDPMSSLAFGSGCVIGIGIAGWGTKLSWPSGVISCALVGGMFTIAKYNSDFNDFIAENILYPDSESVVLNNSH